MSKSDNVVVMSGISSTCEICGETTWLLNAHECPPVYLVIEIEGDKIVSGYWEQPPKGYMPIPIRAANAQDAAERYVWQDCGAPDAGTVVRVVVIRVSDVTLDEESRNVVWVEGKYQIFDVLITTLRVAYSATAVQVLDADIPSEKDGGGMEEWISVEDRLPEYIARAGSDCFVHVIAAHILGVTEAMYCNGKWSLVGGLDVGQYVTHWQPLPEHPGTAVTRENGETQ